MSQPARGRRPTRSLERINGLDGLFETNRDISPQVRMYYKDSPMRRKIDALLAELKEAEESIVGMDIDALPEGAGAIEEKRKTITSALGELLGAMLKGYLGP